MANNLPYKLSLDDLQFQRKLDGAINKTGKLDSKMKGIGKTGNGVANQLSSGFGKLGGAIAGAFAVSKVVDFGKAVIDSLSKYEMFMSSITTMLGGDKGLANALNTELTKLAKTTPFSLEDVQTGSKQLLAYGFQAGSITKNLKTLGNVASGVGAPLGDIVYLYGTLKTQGRAYAKDIQQFTGRGIPIIKELAKQFKTTDSNVMQLVKDGKIGFAQIEKAFQSMTSEGGQFFNLMEEQSKTVGGRLSNLSDTWEQIKINIGKSQRGIISGTVAFLDEMANNINTKLAADNYTEDALKKTGTKLPSWMSSFLGNLGYNTEGRRLQGEAVAGQEQVANSTTSYKQAQLELQVLGIRKKEEEAKLKSAMASNDPYVRQTALEKFNQISSILLETTKQISDGLRLKKTDPLATTPENDPSTVEKGIATGIEESVMRPQNLYINIDKLIEKQVIETTTLTESLPQIKSKVSQALLEAVNDINNTVK